MVGSGTEKKVGSGSATLQRVRDYDGRLQELGCYRSWAERRQHANMTLVNGVLTGKIDIVPADWFTVRQPQTVAETRNKIHC